MKNKYYTPKLKEFNVGFEYEYQMIFLHTSPPTTTNEWTKYVYPEHDLKHLKTFLKYIRVKYLDREDIESLVNVFNTVGNKTYITDNKNVPIVIELKNKTVTIKTVIEKEQLFEGTIKNKSELKDILIKTGVIN